MNLFKAEPGYSNYIIYIEKLTARQHVTYALASLHWLRVSERILFKVAVLTYRAVNGSAPEYLSSYFVRVANVPSRLRL